LATLLAKVTVGSWRPTAKVNKLIGNFKSWRINFQSLAFISKVYKQPDCLGSGQMELAIACSAVVQYGFSVNNVLGRTKTN
jgi:hypothetical protein